MNEPSANNRLSRLCDRFRRRMSWLIGRAGIVRAVCVAILLLGGILLVDWWYHLSSGIRLAALAAYLTAFGLTVWRTLITPLARRFSDREVLAYLDATESGGMLLDLYELETAADEIEESRSEPGRRMTAAAIDEMAPLADKVALGDSFAHGSTRRWSALAGVLVLLLIGFGLVAPDYLAIGCRRLLLPFSSVRWPHRTTIVVGQPQHGWTVPQLEPFTVRAEVTGEVPDQVTLAYRVASSGQWVREQVPVVESAAAGEPSDGEPVYKVQYEFPQVREELEFSLEGGDYLTDRHTISVIERPYLTRIVAHYAYPEYAGLPDRSLASGQLSGLEGTRVRLELESSMPLDRAVLLWEAQDPDRVSANALAGDNGVSVPSRDGGAEPIELKQLSDTTFEHSLMLKTNGRYAVELYEANGYREAKPEVYEIRVTPDDPPEVALLSPGGDLVETHQASIPVAFRANDKLGLSKVEFVYQVDDADPQVLGDRFTGPIDQTGQQSEARFSWDLRRMELPESGRLRFFVRVHDNNPTGRGRVESQPGEIRLVRPSEFHLEAIEAAKLLEEEARIAWRNQLHAWQAAGRWRTEGTGAADDEPWSALVDAQEKSFNAARQMQYHLDVLAQKYQRNHMAQDFMANRLSVVTELLAELQNERHTSIQAALSKARPMTAADATPARQKILRGEAVARSADDQKMAVLILERILRKLYDWRDLQNSTVTTKLLDEQQGEVLQRTGLLAPKTIAREIEDLNDDDQQTLLTLGKQQRAIFDTETGLENQLTYLMYKAERQQRRSILEPLQVAFKNLRDQRVNHHLKRAAEMIENNQPSQILDNQKAARRALKVVERGLVVAGQKVDKDPPLDLASMPANEAQFDPDLVKPEQVAEAKPQPSDQPAESDPGEVAVEIPILAEGTDDLSTAVRLSLELEDNVLARTRYLDKNRTSAEMPRFVRLKLLRLVERQSDALTALQRAAKLAPAEEPGHARHLLALVQEEFSQSRTLLEAKLTGVTVQQLQADVIETLKGLLQHVALAQAVDDATAENRRLQGVDTFGRPYLLRADDLDTVTAMLLDIGFARLLEQDVVRKLQRFTAQPPTGDPASAIETKNRQRAAAAQNQMADVLERVASRASSISAEVSEQVQDATGTALDVQAARAVAGQIAKADSDAALAGQLGQVVETLSAAQQALQNLLEQRVRPKPQLVQTSEQPKMTIEEFNKLTSREHLAERLKNEAGLPPEIRDRMVRALERKFPPKYRDLLRAYYGSFIGESSPAQATQQAKPEAGE